MDDLDSTPLDAFLTQHTNFIETVCELVVHCSESAKIMAQAAPCVDPFKASNPALAILLVEQATRMMDRCEMTVDQLRKMAGSER